VIVGNAAPVGSGAEFNDDEATGILAELLDPGGTVRMA
jgi:hypothetical protein